MCLTVESDLLDTDSLAKRVRWIAEGAGDRECKSSQCGDREQERSAGPEYSPRDVMGDPSSAGMIPNWKIVEQQLGTVMEGKQTRERVTRKSEY
jgi:hypothetical protein